MLRNEPLAIFGGTPVLPEGPPAWPVPDDEVLAALQAAYRDGSWGRYHGPHCEQLAARLAERFQTPHVSLCASGTVAVELALRGLKIGDGDEVLLAAYDFPGNFRAIEAVGARPVLVDIDPATWCLDASRLEDALGQTTRAILVSHLHGGLAAMPEICDLAMRRGLAVVEDACQAPGARVAGRPAGSWGDAGVLSFGGSKLLTAGRGGAVLTRHAEVQQRIRVFADRGNDAFPLSELQAAVLLPQLQKLAERNDRRRDNVLRLLAACAGLKSLRPVRIGSGDSCSAFYKLAFQYDAAACGGRSRDDFLAAMQAEGVALDSGFRGFARRSQRRCRSAGSLEHSERAAAATVLLHHPVLLAPAETMDRVAAAVRKVAGE